MEHHPHLCYSPRWARRRTISLRVINKSSMRFWATVNRNTIAWWTHMMFLFLLAQIQRPPNSIVYLSVSTPFSTKQSAMWPYILSLISHAKPTNSSVAKNCVTTTPNYSTRTSIPVWSPCAAWNSFVSTARTITMTRRVWSKAKYLFTWARQCRDSSTTVRSSLGAETAFPRRFTCANHCGMFAILDSGGDWYSSKSERHRARSDGE